MEAKSEVRRLAQLQTAISQAGLDAVALNPGPTFTYLAGVSFHLMERPVVMIVPARGRAGAGAAGIRADQGERISRTR